MSERRVDARIGSRWLEVGMVGRRGKQHWVGIVGGRRIGWFRSRRHAEAAVRRDYYITRGAKDIAKAGAR